MTKARSMQSFSLSEIARDDRDRLVQADQALEIAEAELQNLCMDSDDLAYLVDVLRFGVKEALRDLGEQREEAQADYARTHH